MVCRAVRISTGWLSEGLSLRLLIAPLLLLAAPLSAQETDPELNALIPDSAVADPEAWAKAAPQAALPTEPQPEPNSPVTQDRLFSLPWPDAPFELEPVLALEPDADQIETLAAQSKEPDILRESVAIQHLSPQLTLVFPDDAALLPDRAALTERFTTLSAIQQLSATGDDSVAQLAARARTDADLLRRLLRIYGYYDGSVEQAISGIEAGTDSKNARPSIRFTITAGPRYHFGTVELGELAQTGKDFPKLRAAFGIQTGDPVDSDRIIAASTTLDTALGESGYTFAKIGEPNLVINHQTEAGDLTLPVTPGGAYTFGIISSSLPDFLPARHLERIARFKRGDLFKRSLTDDLRRAIIATGLVSSVTVTPRETRSPHGETPGAVELDVALAKAPLRTIAGAIGYDSGEGFRVEASWEHRNLLPPEGLLRLRAVVGTKEQLAGVTLRRNNFRGRDQVLTLDIYANSVQRDAYVARTAVFSASFEKLTTLLFQKPWVWSVGAEAIATREREGDIKGVGSPPQNYYVFALPVRAAFDTSDNLLDPSRGFRAALRVSPEFSFDQGRKANYVRIQADASAYLPLGDRAVLAARARMGSIPGTDIQNIAPSRRFYAGGGGSVRGYGYQQIGPRNSFSAPSGGRSLSEFSLEARVKTGLFGKALSVVPFVDAGTVAESVSPQFSGMRYGAGLGLRYQTGFGPIRIDLGTPINRREGESRVAVYVSLGQAF